MPKISDEKREKRCRQILDAAGKCFALKGFHRTTIKDIVRESKLSPGAIYCYFRGKDNIVTAIADQRHDRETALLAEFKMAGATSKAFRTLARDLLEMQREPRQEQRRKVTIQFWSESLRNKAIRKIVERGLRQRDVLAESLRIGQRKGFVKKDLDADALSRVMLAILQGFILQKAWEPRLSVDSFLESANLLMNSAFTDRSSKPSRSSRQGYPRKRSPAS
jgi:AcrR family transcriptional regulator